MFGSVFGRRIRVLKMGAENKISEKMGVNYGEIILTEFKESHYSFVRLHGTDPY